MKTGWQTVKLGEVCENIFAGGDVPKESLSDVRTTEFNIPIYSNGEKKDGLYGYTDKPRVTKPSITVSARGTIGYTVIRNEPFLPVVRLIVLTPNERLISLRFLYYTIISMDFGNTGTSIPQLTVPNIKTYNLRLPPPSEQKRIVAILDKAFEGIDKAIAQTEQNLASARELFESYLNNIFTQKGDDWEERELGEVASFKNGLNFTKNSKGESIKIVGVKDFQNYSYIKTDELDTVIADGSVNDDYLLIENDILTVRSNGNKNLIGRCILMMKTSDKMTFSGFTIRIRLHDAAIFPEYMLRYLKSEKAKEMLISSGGGISISSLNQKALSSLPIQIPTYDEQKIIVDDIRILSKHIQQLEALYTKKLESLKELKQSFLQKAFAGELTKDDAA